MFIGKTEPTPMGRWIPAENIKTKGFAHRPGWHVGSEQQADHLLKKDGTMDKNRVWALVEIPADINYQSEADSTPTGDIRGRVPVGGHYTFKRPQKQGSEWLIAGAIKVVKLLK